MNLDVLFWISVGIMGVTMITVAIMAVVNYLRKDEEEVDEYIYCESDNNHFHIRRTHKVFNSTLCGAESFGDRKIKISSRLLETLTCKTCRQKYRKKFG